MCKLHSTRQITNIIISMTIPLCMLTGFLILDCNMVKIYCPDRYVTDDKGMCRNTDYPTPITFNQIQIGCPIQMNVLFALILAILLGMQIYYCIQLGLTRQHVYEMRRLDTLLDNQTII